MYLMKVLKNVPLALYSTMRLGGKARYLVHVHSEDDLTEALDWAALRREPFLMIGSGANIIFSDNGYKGLVAVNDIKGLDIKSEGSSTIISVGSGEIWDNIVAQSVQRGLTGIEALSKIPGKAGAAPVQNIGAYGQEIAQTLIEVRAYDTKNAKFVTLSNQECGFAYRSSRFNRQDKGRFYITRLSLRLKKGSLQPPYYRDIETYLYEHDTVEITPAVVRKAVTQIRAKKLPDPSVVANCGSFFYNPILSEEAFGTFAQKHPEINKAPAGWSQPPRWFLDGGKVKISAGWLLEQAGFKAYEDKKTGMALWPHQNLVFINKHARSTADLLAFKQRIVQKVRELFGISLEQEPEFIEI